MSINQNFIKDPDAKLDYSFDWSDWLADNETIVTYVITVDNGITVESHTAESGVVTVWISGGTEWIRHKVSCKIYTSLDRVDERTIWILVQNR